MSWRQRLEQSADDRYAGHRLAGAADGEDAPRGGGWQPRAALEKAVDEDYVADVGKKKIGAGFRWAKFGARTLILRPTPEPIFLLRKPPRQSPTERGVVNARAR